VSTPLSSPPTRALTWFWSATAVSGLGDGARSGALPLLVLASVGGAGGATGLAVLGIAATAPWLLLSLVAGVYADRSDRQALMVRCDLTRAAVGALLAAYLLFRDAPVTVLVAFLAVVTGAEVFFDCAAQAALSDLVPIDRLERANSRLFATQSVTALVGPVLGVALVPVSHAAAIGLDAASFGVSAYCLARAGRRGVWAAHRVPTPTAGDAPARLSDGMRWLFADPRLVWMAGTLCLLNLAVGGPLALLALHAVTRLHSPHSYGLLLAAVAAGALVAAPFAAAATRRLGLRRSVAVAAALESGGLAGTGLTGSPLVAVVALLVFGAGSMVWNVASVSARQRFVATERLGRVNSVFRLIGWATLPLSAALAGPLAAASDTRTVFVGGAVIGVAAVGVAMTLERRPANPA
jgi:MFS family permease